MTIGEVTAIGKFEFKRDRLARFGYNYFNKFSKH